LKSFTARVMDLVRGKVEEKMFGRGQAAIISGINRGAIRN
jgi:hypothetical protein